MKVLLFSRYGTKGASSRVRYLQYIPYLESQGVSIEISPLFSNHYLECLYAGKKAWGEVLQGYLKRLVKLLGVGKYDLLIIEKELFPFLPALAERVLSWLGIPYLVDYDDALFHRYDLNRNLVIRKLLSNKIDSVMRHASVVVVGNDYLADRARRAGAKNVVTIPTVVDDTRYRVADSKPSGDLVVGWIGTPKTSKYLEPLIPLFEGLRQDQRIRIVAVGARAEDFPAGSLEVWEWSEESEIERIQQFDVGIMPLPDSPWERGKCGYKLIQYMACGKPVIASPVGVNASLVEHGINGYLADTDEAWLVCLTAMFKLSSSERESMGRMGRLKVEGDYSLRSQAPRLLELIHTYAR